jgi:hypothetical protein
MLWGDNKFKICQYRFQAKCIFLFPVNYIMDFVEVTRQLVRKTRFTPGRVRELKNARNSVTVRNRTHVYMNFFGHKDLVNHLLK